MGLNIDELVDLTRWAKKTGADGIYFQPIEPIYASNQTLVQLKKTKLWVSNKQKALARKKIDELIKIKTKEGFIINDLDNLKKIKEYFELTQVKKTQKRKHCAIDLTTLFIDPLGKISFCPSYPKLNSLNKYKTQAILYSKNALKQRKIIRNCPKAGNCLSTCVSEKNLLQLIHLFLFLNK
ncbi:MAG: hypothetical protein GYA31_02010 [Parcubacteria group bacterium]|nr:hypothetical protein [Parcubacteria group bacterium]